MFSLYYFLKYFPEPKNYKNKNYKTTKVKLKHYMKKKMIINKCLENIIKLLKMYLSV